VPASGVVLWSTIAPLTALALIGLRRALPWLAAYFVVVVVLALAEATLSIDPSLLPPGIILTFFVMNCIGTMLSSFVLLGYYVHQSELARDALAVERERSERLLLNVLPEPIAAQLKEHHGVIAERHEAVTVLFADLVGFTQQTAGMQAEDLVEMLDEIFSAFDAIVGAEDLEKIKTIGDAYMVAGGLPEPRADNVEAVARVALAMQSEVAAIAQRGEHPWLNLRIGIDSGPVVAGVVGRRKFIYDIWGDTVNTASRMESHGSPGRIQLTARAAEGLGSSFILEPRGIVDVKGKGPMETFLLGGRA
jgi:adenylate cyclase